MPDKEGEKNAARSKGREAKVLSEAGRARQMLDDEDDDEKKEGGGEAYRLYRC